MSDKFPKLSGDCITDRMRQRKAEAKRQAHSPAPPCSVERTSLSVIEHKLLTALNDESKVAIIATKQNLEDMLIALEGAVWNGREIQLRCKELADGMRQLLSEAFPPNTD